MIERSDLMPLGHDDRELALAQLHDDVRLPFSLERLAYRRQPVRALSTDLLQFEWPHRINQCLVKPRNADCVELGPFENPAALQLINECVAVCEQLGLGWRERYLYLTIDTQPVEAGHTQRIPGWHFDDLQGPDIINKMPGGFLFVGASSLPTEFALQSFNTDGVDDRVHNVFNWCARQVDDRFITPQWPGSIALLSAYDVHRAVPAITSGPRVFVRLLFTHCALTSRKTTLNPRMSYDHIPHQTNGLIPAHLI
jgi:hypothetical protein